MAGELIHAATGNLGEALAVGLVEQLAHRGVDLHHLAEPALLDGADE